MRRMSESAPARPAGRRSVADAHAVQEGGLRGGPEVPVDQVAGLGYHGGRYEQDLVVPNGEPLGALGVVLIPAIGQGIQDVGVDDDHEVSRLPAEALPEQPIGSLGHIGPPAVPDPDECRQGTRSPVAWKLADEWLKQPEGARSLLLAEPGDKLLQLLLGCHMFSLRGSIGYR